MKSIVIVLFLGTLFLLTISLKWDNRIEPVQLTPLIKENQDSATHLTSVEETDLKKLTDQLLPWVAKWEPRPWRCKSGEEINMPAIIKQHEDNVIEMRLVIRENNMTVYLIPLHLKFVVSRLHDLGLGSPNIEYFCDNSYEDLMLGEKQVSERFQARKSAIENQKPILTSSNIHELNQPTESQESSIIAANKVELEETRTYQVPRLIETSLSNQSMWEADKKALYEKIVTVIRNQVEQFHCSSGKATKVEIPDFNIMDPAIYILVIPPNLDDISIEWFNFTRNRSTGEYEVYPVKSISLPEERLKYLRSMVELRKINQQKIVCLGGN